MSARERLARQSSERFLVVAGGQYLSLRHGPERVDDGIGDPELPDALTEARYEVRVGRSGTQAPGTSSGQRDSEHLGGPGDAGLDGLIRLDPLGLDVVYVQAKRYTDQHVGRPDIQAFVGALHGAQASRGIFITTSRFSSQAVDYADRVNARLVLIDGPELAALMIEHDCGVIVEESFVLKQVDENFFEEP
jgi:restriction endonuclease Mrr